MAVIDHFALTPKRQSDAWWSHAQILDGHRIEVVQVVAMHMGRVRVHQLRRLPHQGAAVCRQAQLDATQHSHPDLSAESQIG